MPNTSKVAVILEMLESAQSSIRSAKAMLSELTGVSAPTASSSYVPQRPLAGPTESAQGRVVEGVFDGQNMIGDDRRTYPVPANYASKSKLVQGDRMKLTITDTGAFIYKQIGPIPRRNTVGIVAFEDGQYKIICEGKALRVLMASITFYKAEVGQKLGILLPEALDAEWATVDNLMPDAQQGADGADVPSAAPDEDDADTAVTGDEPEADAETPIEEAPAPAPKRRKKAAS